LEAKVSKFAKPQSFINIDNNIKDFMQFCHSFLRQQNRGNNLKNAENIDCLQDLIDYQAEVKKVIDELEEQKNLNNTDPKDVVGDVRKSAEQPTIREMLRENDRDEEEDR